jgi:plasmid stabilization system protein ParE
MTFQPLFEQDAEIDIFSIADWYRDQRNGLEDDFLHSLKASLDSLVKNPFQYQVKFRGVRAVLLQKIPYQVFYKISDNSIIVLGVIHTSRNPKLIKRRGNK